MSDHEIFNELMKEIKKGFSRIKSGRTTMSDYYFSMCDYFKQLEPDKGFHYGFKFNFKEDAEEFKQLAINKLKKEKE